MTLIEIILLLASISFLFWSIPFLSKRQERAGRSMKKDALDLVIAVLAIGAISVIAYQAIDIFNGQESSTIGSGRVEESS